MNSKYKNVYVFFLVIYLVALPLGAISIEGFGSALKLLAILPLLFAVFSLERFNYKSPVKTYFFYALICGVSVIYAWDKSAAWDKFWSLFLLFLVLASTSFFRYSDKDLSKLKKALIWSSRISVILCLIFNNFKEGRMYFDNGIFIEDPNYFCAYLAFGTIFAVEKILNDKRIIFRILSLAELSVYLVVAFLTGSRGGTIALLCGIIIFIIFSFLKVISLKTIIMMLIVPIAFYIGFSFLSEEILARFTIQNVLATGGTGRFDIWEKAFWMFDESNIFRKLFGQGIGNTVTSWPKYGISEFHVCHNMFIESLVEIGIVGLIMYVIMISSFLKAAFVDRQKYAFAVMMVMVFLSLSTSIATFKPYINIMIYILCSANKVKEEKPVKAIYFDSPVPSLIERTQI